MHQTSSTSTATPPKHAFEARVADVKSPKRYEDIPYMDIWQNDDCVNGNLSELHEEKTCIYLVKPDIASIILLTQTRTNLVAVLTYISATSMP